MTVKSEQTTSEQQQNENIKLVALVIVELLYSERISQAVS